MNDTEKVLSFGEMVNASQKMNKPWIIICGLLIVALIVSNFFWAYVHYKQIEFAYMTPETYSQTQDFDGMTQSQGYEQGTTQGG